MLQQRQWGCAKVTVIDTVTIIPASSEIKVRASICSTINGLWVVKGNKANKSGVCVARAYEMVPLRVVNTGLTPTRLCKDPHIGTTEQINESTTCQAVEGEEQTSAKAMS